MRLLILNGPNLNMLGLREPNVYGNKNYRDLKKYIKNYCKKHNISVKIIQTNNESKYLANIHKANSRYDYIILNPGAWTHYSYSIRDAISSIDVPCYEVHLTDIKNREDFRKISVIRGVCVDSVKGLGFDSYTKAIKKMRDKL
ncbi:3-dehydroquinate dehydratase [Mycoplasmatota bacterium]|nr:3-dehydroquinate dehydratase [Mycoplasmatota bacterium]